MSELKVVVGMNEGKVLCISNDKRIIKSAMFDYLFETSQEFAVDFFELRNWGEYDIEIFNYEQQPQLNDNQQIVLEWLKGRYKDGSSLFNAIQGFRGFNGVPAIELNALMSLSNNEESQVLQAFAKWILEQEEE